jgi:hypothetical protein
LVAPRAHLGTRTRAILDIQGLQRQCLEYKKNPIHPERIHKWGNLKWLKNKQNRRNSIREVWRVSRRTGRTIRIFSVEVSKINVLRDIRNFAFVYFWHLWVTCCLQSGYQFHICCPHPPKHFIFSIFRFSSLSSTSK